MISKVVSFSNKCAYYFDKDIKKEGEEIFSQNLLRVFDAKGISLKAYTLGNTTHNPQLEWVELKSYLAIKTKCDCRRYKITESCAHLWSLILSAENDSFSSKAKNLSKIEFISSFEKELDLPIVEAQFSQDIQQRETLDHLSKAIEVDHNDIKLISSIEDNKERSLYFRLFPNYEMQTGFLRIEFVIDDKSLVLTDSVIRDLKSEDRAIVEILRRLNSVQSKTYWSRKKIKTKGSYCEIPVESLDILLPSIVAKGLVTQDHGRLEFNPKEKLICHNKLDHTNSWKFIPYFKFYKTTVTIDEITLINNLSLAIYNGRIIKIEYRGLKAFVSEYKKGKTEFKKESLSNEDIQNFVHKYPQLSKIDLPKELKITKKKVSPIIKMSLDLSAGVQGVVLWAQFTSAFNEQWHSPLSPMPLKQDDNRFIIEKDEDKEIEIYEKLSHILNIRVNHKDFTRKVKIETDNFNETITKLIEIGVEVFAKNKRVSVPNTSNISLKTKDDWFEVKSSIEFDEESLYTPQILALAKSGQNLVPLKNGTLGLLPEEWLRKHLHLEYLADQKDERFLIAKDHSLYLDLLFEEKLLKTDRPQYSELISKLKKIKQAPSVVVPKTFKGVLRDYQQDGVNWLNFLDELGLGGCLADEMGLGKTVQILAHLERLRTLKRSKHLIVVPKSLTYNWLRECEKFCPKIKVKVYEGTKEQRASLLKKKFDLLICTYGIIRNDIHDLKEIEFDTIILDEAQHIKNENSRTARSVLLLNARQRFIATGTPVENSLAELFSLFKFLSPTIFGQKKISRENLTDGNESVVTNILKGLRPLILRRLKSDVLKDLPEKTESILQVQLSAEQRKIYQDLKDHYRSKLMDKVEKFGIKKSKIHILEALLRLRQAACHPGLINPTYKDSKSAKLDALMEKLNIISKTGEKTLVFSQFTQFLKLLEARLIKEGIKYSYLDGQTNNRQSVVDDFKQSDEKVVFLISLKAGGYGLNLTEANYCFLLDPWWNPAVEGQAIDRIHRIGQFKKVFAYKLLSENTIEEKIIILQNKKRKLMDDLLYSNDSVIKDIDSSDLTFLFS
ncbi:DEAD/DEAH box helicase [Halobacteriovorax sp. HLS]|uniref:DEAD/DEAH box helicase n=1 Tax=Halobacteriovorax sp. HLS TaxID=2234000 RepID=UPI000FDA6F27|nr:DEAD/DEAH box helicase [Halobacteriovorax sp. HLS]